MNALGKQNILIIIQIKDLTQKMLLKKIFLN